MSDIIATIWDFDKTLITGYMQEPLFKEYKIDGKTFWKDCNAEVERYRALGYEVNPDTHYLNLILRYVRDGKFPNLNNEKLRGYGRRLSFYPGAIELLAEIKALNEEADYKDYGVRFENYIVSTGLKKVIEGSPAARHVVKIWGCEFLEDEARTQITEVGYSLDNTTKTRALFEISKGVGIGINKEAGIDVNTRISPEDRRVQFVNMIYVADGPSDIPAFSVINKNHGATFAVYPQGSVEAFRQVEAMRRDGRVQMYAPADYQKGSTAYMWLMDRIRTQAGEIIQGKKQALEKYRPGTPKHIV